MSSGMRLDGRVWCEEIDRKDAETFVAAVSREGQEQREHLTLDMLADYFADALEDEQKKRIELHLAECDSCATTAGCVNIVAMRFGCGVDAKATSRLRKGASSATSGITEPA